MKAVRTRASNTDDERTWSDLALDLLGLAWHVVRLPILAFLVVLEPIVRVLLSGVAMLGVIVAFLFEFSGAVPGFPFWQTIFLSFGCVCLLVIYHRLLHLFAR